MADLVLRVAAKAVLVNEEGKILILREASTYEEGTNHGRYSLPGGRLNTGESYEDGLKREVEEETGITDFEPLYPVYVGEWRPVIKGVPHQIIGIFTVCKVKSGEVKLSLEHDHYQWVSPEEWSEYDIMEAEVKAAQAYLRFRK